MLSKKEIEKGFKLFGSISIAYCPDLIFLTFLKWQITEMKDINDFSFGHTGLGVKQMYLHRVSCGSFMRIKYSLA